MSERETGTYCRGILHRVSRILYSFDKTLAAGIFAMFSKLDCVRDFEKVKSVPRVAHHTAGVPFSAIN
jgi:hypothetical protein